MELLWFYNREGVYRDGTIDEKVTVISSVVHTYIRTYVHTKPSWKLEMGSVLFFLLLKLGTPQLHLVISMKMTVIFSNKSRARLII
jgi:hypothetical protein